MDLTRRKFFFLSTLALLGTQLPNGQLWTPTPKRVLRSNYMEMQQVINDIYVPGLSKLLNPASPLLTYVENH